MFDERLTRAAESLMQCCLQHGVRLVFSESCTGGLISASIVSLPGSSRVFDRAYVSYSYESREQDLGVDSTIFEAHGAVSQQAAIAMAEGALRNAKGNANLSIGVTGVAGPGSTPEKPIGLAYIACCFRSGSTEPSEPPRTLHQQHRFGNLPRNEVQKKTAVAAMELAIRTITESDSHNDE